MTDGIFLATKIPCLRRPRDPFEKPPPQNLIYNYNKNVVNHFIETYFLPKTNNQISEIEDELVKLYRISLKAVGLKIIGPALSFGSTSRNTHIEDDVDIDIAANLKISSVNDFEKNINLQENLKKEVRKNLLAKRFNFGEFNSFKKMGKKPFYKSFIENVSHESYTCKIKRIDLILNLLPNINIGIVNQRVIKRKLNQIEKALGPQAKSGLLAQIRFTKWLFKQKQNLVDSYGRKRKKGVVIINAKRGLRSIHIEQSLIQISQEEDTGNYLKTGYFDALMSLLYNIDWNYRKGLPLGHESKIIPLDRAKNIPLLRNIKRSEYLQEFSEISQRRFFQDYLATMNACIFDDFEDRDKWNILIGIARDYFEDRDFKNKYLHFSHRKKNEI